MGSEKLYLVQKYKYLGVLLDEHLNFNYDIFTHLFKTRFSHVIMYGSEVCGYNRFDNCDKIQYRAMRFFLGVHTCTHMNGLQGDIGWVSLYIDRCVIMMRFWNRLMNMSNDRLTKRVFCRTTNCVTIIGRLT